MIRTQLLAALACVLAAWTAVPCSAVEAPSDTYVLLVGINKYGDKQIIPRKFAEEDAISLYELFANQKYLGVKKDQMRLLLGDTERREESKTATRENIMAGLKWLKEKAQKNDLIVIGLFCQGAPLAQKSCYFATDSTVKDRAKNAIGSGDVKEILDDVNRDARLVVFADVNFLGFKFKKKNPPHADLSNFYEEFLGESDEKGDRPNRVVFLANNGLSPTLRYKKHGLFTHVVIEGLQGKADVEGYEPDGLITVDELAEFVREKLPEIARETGKTDKEKSQRPPVLRNRQTNFVIDHNPAAYPRVQKELKTFKRLVKKNKLSDEVYEEGYDLLSRMPKLGAQQSLRKAYQSFVAGRLTSANFEIAREKIKEAMGITEREASEYAILVMQAVRIVGQSYFKKVGPNQMVQDAIRGLYRTLDENIPSKLEERIANAKELKTIDLVKLLADARRHLGTREDLAKGQDVTNTLHSMLGKLDRHTGYIDPDTVIRILQDTQGEFYGIGVQIRQNLVRNHLEVITPIKGSPAYKAKILAGDLITKIIRDVDSEGNKLDEPEILSTKGMSTSDAVKKIVGRKGTPVKVVIEREGSPNPLTFTLVRGKVEIETVLGHKRTTDDTWSYVVDPVHRICYVRLSGFSKNTYRDLRNVMKGLSKDGIKGFILDLRFNPGGLLDSAVKISDLFVEDGLIVTVRPRNGSETSYVGKSDGTFAEFPMVCLINGDSASASEIVSACLQDHGRAIIMGSRSYGKGSVQTIHRFSGTGGILKLTTATFWRPNDKNLNKASTKGRPQDEWGVKPNPRYNLELPPKELDSLRDYQRKREIIHRPDRPLPKLNFQDRQLDMALQYLRSQIKTAYKNGGKKAG